MLKYITLFGIRWFVFGIFVMVAVIKDQDPEKLRPVNVFLSQNCTSGLVHHISCIFRILSFSFLLRIGAIASTDENLMNNITII